MTLPSFFKPQFVISRSWLIFLFIVSFVVLLSASFQWARHNDLFVLSAGPSQRFTELYFTDPSNVPAKPKANTPYAVPFTIANHEGEAKTYAVLATVKSGSTVISSHRTSFIVPDGKSHTEKVSFTLPDLTGATTLSVELLNEDQVITYTMGRY